MQELEFDFVIAGGGSAGCVLAARLAADSRARVALLEQGRRDSNRWIHIPATFFKVLQSRDAAVVTSAPDASLNDRAFPVPGGRVLGGGSSVNGMIYMRGQQADYDAWADQHGCSGWDYNAVLPIFRRQEKNIRIDNAWHGTEGKLIVADPAPQHPLCQSIIEAGLAAGIPANDDFNGATQEGVGWYQVTAHAGQRQSAAHCFLKPELGRENLSLLTGLQVRRIRIENRRATAVEARDENGQDWLIRARREIIVTAGSLHSPKILMLSGVGPRDELNRHGIEIQHEADEVGRNYHDHVGTPVTRKLLKKEGLFGADKGLAALRHGFDYFVLKRGLLNSNLLQAGACVDTLGSGRPDVQYNFAPFAPGAPGSPPLPYHALQIHPMTMRPVSRGRVGLASADPAAAPKLEANALAAEEDLDALRRGVRLAREMFEKSPLAEITGEEIWPGPDISSRIGSNSLDDAIRAHARTIYHPAGTCRMGSDAAAVVDTELRVQGVEGLRVADCSIMPALTSGNTNAPTMMIADRAADFILADSHF